MRMAMICAIAVPLVTITNAPAVTQDNPCSLIANNSERLACYDAAARAPTRTAGNEGPYSLRGYQLGITIDDLRKVPYPDRDKYPSARAICTQDKEKEALKKSISYGSSLEPSGLFGRAGVILCRFFTNTREVYAASPELRKHLSSLTKEQANELSEGSFDFAGVGGWPIIFMFTPATLEKEKAARLFSIRVDLNNRHFDEVVTAFRARYGEPSGKSISQFKTRVGAEFENLTHTWTNGVSTITIERYADTINVMSITYLHNELMLETNKAAERAGKALGGKL